MNDTPISLTQRIAQANTRLERIARRWYMGKMTNEQFQAERQEILDFIDAESRIPDVDVELEPALHEQVMPKPIQRSDDFTPFSQSSS